MEETGKEGIEGSLVVGYGAGETERSIIALMPLVWVTTWTQVLGDVQGTEEDSEGRSGVSFWTH